MASERQNASTERACLLKWPCSCLSKLLSALGGSNGSGEARNLSRKPRPKRAGESGENRLSLWPTDNGCGAPAPSDGRPTPTCLVVQSMACFAVRQAARQQPAASAALARPRRLLTRASRGIRAEDATRCVLSPGVAAYAPQRTRRVAADSAEPIEAIGFLPSSTALSCARALLARRPPCDRRSALSVPVSVSLAHSARGAPLQRPLRG
eukprot:366551-Chlamydomonas_euryale.AAC.41